MTQAPSAAKAAGEGQAAPGGRWLVRVHGLAAAGPLTLGDVPVASETLVRDALELLVVVAVGGILFTSVRRLRRGQVRVSRCPACLRPVSRVYARCPHCGASPTA